MGAAVVTDLMRADCLRLCVIGYIEMMLFGRPGLVLDIRSNVELLFF
jgi:hypothetical protein